MSSHAQACDDIEARFRHYKPKNDSVVEDHVELRALLKTVALDAIACVPPGRERSLMLTKLEEAMFWGNAGIARS